MKCFNYPMRENMMRLAIVWFTLSFGWVSFWCHLCHRKIRHDFFLLSHNSARQSGLRPHCISVMLISLLCRSCMVPKSISVCGSILVHWCLSGSRDNSESGQRFKNTLKTLFKIKQKPQVSPVLLLSLTAHLREYLYMFLPGLSLKSTFFAWSIDSLHILIWLYPSGCRYYGLSVWFPDVIKHLQADDYASKVKIHDNERIEDFTFNFTLENQIHKNGLFINDR